MGVLCAVLAIASTIAAAVTAYALGRRTTAQRARPSQHQYVEAASMGHELRNRLTALVGYVDLLAERFPTTSPHPRAALDAEILKLLRLAVSLEHVGSLEARGVLPDSMDIPALLSKVVADRQAKSEASSAKLVFETQPGAVSEARLTLSAEELEILVGNVIDHATTVSDGRKVTIVLAAADTGKAAVGFLQISVTHDSSTYSAREVQHLLASHAAFSSPSYDLPLSERIHLNAAAALAKRAGGTLRYVPNIPSGGRFIIQLSCTATAMKETTAPEVRPDTAPSLADCYARHRIFMKGRSLAALVLEDQVSNQNVLRAYLVGAGHRVSIAGTVNEAIRLLNSNAFDLAIVDLRLPQAGGVEFIQRAKLEFRQSCPRFLVVTGEPGPATAKALRSTGVTRFLTKPVTASQLLDAVAQTAADLPTNALTLRHTELERNLRSAFDRGDIAGPMADSFSYVRQLSVDAKRGDWDSFRRAARALRGAAHLLGATNLFSLCTIVIDLPDPSLTRQAIDLAAELENELIDVQATLINFSTTEH